MKKKSKKRNIGWCGILILVIGILVFESKNGIDITYFLFLIIVLGRYLMKTNV